MRIVVFPAVPLSVPLSSSGVSDGGQALYWIDFNDDRTIAAAWCSSCISCSEQVFHWTFCVGGFVRITMSCSVGIIHADTLVTLATASQNTTMQMLSFYSGMPQRSPSALLEPDTPTMLRLWKLVPNIITFILILDVIKAAFLAPKKCCTLINITHSHTVYLAENQSGWLVKDN